MSGPTIYLTNSASVAAVACGNAKPETAACVGPGPVLSIMRFPREEMGDAGVGRVLSLTPPSRLAAPAIAAKKAADRHKHTADCPANWIALATPCDCGHAELAAAWSAYEAALLTTWGSAAYLAYGLAPGSLAYGAARRGPTDGAGVVSWDLDFWARVGEVPDGATLICACSREAAAAGRCHRVIAADLLKRAGWSVVLDGRIL